MAVSNNLLLVSSLAISLLILQLAPQFSVRQSYLWTAVVFYSIQLLGKFSWNVVIYPKLLSPLRHLPQPKGANFFMGQLGRIIRDPTGIPMREWTETVPNDGLIYYTHALNAPRVLVTSPKALAEVLVHKNYEFIKPRQLRDGLGRILGVGILLAEGDEHKRQRKLLMPAFSFRHVKNLYHTFWSKAREVTEAMTAALQKPETPEGKPSSVLEVSGWASRATLDIIGVAGLGQDFHAIENPNSELMETYRKIFAPNRVARIMQILGTFLPLPLLRRLPVKRNEDIEEASRTIKRVCYDLIQKKREEMKGGKHTDVDILSVAMESGGFSDEDLVNQLMTFLAAGHETTASSMTWAIYLLCKHPEVQKRLREEIRSNLPSISDSNAAISSADIDRLHYLNAVCNETLRVYSPVALTLRIAAHDTTILGHFIPEDTVIILCPWAINLNKQLWGDDAEQFNPDRWMGPGRANTGGADSNYSFLTFLHGPRSCIGQGFAKAEFACLLAAWVGRFEMEFEDPDFKLEYGSGVTVKPKGGLRVKTKTLDGW